MPVIRNTGGFEGRIFIDGEPVEVNSPYDALELGIGMVHQEFMLLPGLTITENIKINREIVKDNLLSKLKKLGILDFERMRRDARKALIGWS